MRTYLLSVFKRRSRRDWLLVGIAFAVIGLFIGASMSMTPYIQTSESTYFYADDSKNDTAYLRAKIIDVQDGTAKLIDSTQRGQLVELGNYNADGLETGDTVLVYKLRGTSESTPEYGLYGQWRLPTLAVVVAVFLLLVVLVAGRQGAMSVIGLFVGLVTIMWGIVPLILHGYSAFWVCLIGAVVIGCASILIAHGARQRTYISLVVVMLIIALIAVLSWFVVWMLNLTGIADEAAAFAASDIAGLDMRGVLAGGIVIATLGVLDDVVTTQVAAVEELSKASKKWSFEKIFYAAHSIGKEHIASLVNTLALAYAGASLPFILLISHSTGATTPLVMLNSEYIVTEVVRTLVASIGLLLAVPISTYIATRYFTSRSHSS